MDPPEDMIEYFTYSLASITYVLVFILVRAPWRLYIRGPGAKLPGAVGWMELEFGTLTTDIYSSSL